jgi:PAS domain S-box-containing protein
VHAAETPSERPLSDWDTQLDLLAETSELLAHAESPSIELLRRIFSRLAHVLAFEIFLQFEAVDHERVLLLRTSEGLLPEQQQRYQKLAFGQYPCGEVAERNQALIVEDVSHSDYAQALELCGAGISLYVGVPLFAQRRLVGTAAFATQRRAHLRPGELRLIRGVCDQVAGHLARSRAERQLRESTALLRAISEHSQSIIYAKDEAGRLRFANPVIAQYFGKQPEELLGRDEFAYVPDPAAIQRIRESDQRIMATRRAEVVEEPIAFREGLRTFISTKAPLFAADGSVTGVMGISHDITQRIAAEQARIESEQRFRTMADGTPLVIWVTDANGKIEFINRAYCEFFGVTLEELQASGGWQPLLHEDDAHTHTEAFQTALREHRAYRASARVRHADGSWRWIESIGVPRFSVDGEYVGMVGSSPDITDRVRAEEELRRALHHSEMFVGILGHDLRTPLSAVLTAAELGVRQAESQLTRSLFERIRSSSTRMGRMIEQLLDVTRIRLGTGLEIRRREIELEQLCRSAADELKHIKPGREIVLDVRGDTRGRWDPDRVAQLVTNLLGNATEHAPRGSRISVFIDGTTPALVLVRVHNAGQIPPAVLPTLFDPFRRGSSASRGAAGLGLGLYICREIALAHGGEIALHSTAADGTTFEVRLPRRTRPSSMPPPANGPPSSPLLRDASE